MTKFYYQQDNGTVYLHLDGGLRHIPNPTTLWNLIKGPLDPASYIQFPDAEAAPFPIFTRWPIANKAKLVATHHPTHAIFLEDKYPWEDSLVLRHVINPTQMNDIGFDWNKVIEIGSNNKIGVPLTTESNTNINLIQQLEGYNNIFLYLIHGRALNPFFKYLLVHFKGYGAPGGEENRKFEAEIKSLIGECQEAVNNLPGTVPFEFNKEQSDNEEIKKKQGENEGHHPDQGENEEFKKKQGENEGRHPDQGENEGYHPDQGENDDWKNK